MPRGAGWGEKVPRAATLSGGTAGLLTASRPCPSGVVLGLAAGPGGRGGLVLPRSIGGGVALVVLLPLELSLVSVPPHADVPFKELFLVVAWGA